MSAQLDICSLKNCLLVRHYPDTERCFIFRNVLLAAVENLRGPFDRTVINIAIKVEYAEVVLSSASLVVHPVDSQFVKEHTMDDNGETSESEKLSMPVCCELDIQGMLMTYGLPLPSPDLLVDCSVHAHVFLQ
ncbi:hypothetical protein RND71_014317 [Anisodus tanguticus]|uniref:Uncharacterized protein n=1 Tax=Anisodus tanguticus TaxID=243964 RepID=A0AAE1SBK6_9SOLA|nr:hypothetical protein RND71_014317 [Anisodus tanguticus]